MAESMRFAGAVMLGDLDDTLGRGQDCINPLFTSNSNQERKEESGAPKISLNSAIFSGFE